jgi:hypothetical protein
MQVVSGSVSKYQAQPSGLYPPGGEECRPTSGQEEILHGLPATQTFGHRSHAKLEAALGAGASPAKEASLGAGASPAKEAALEAGASPAKEASLGAGASPAKEAALGAGASPARVAEQQGHRRSPSLRLSTTSCLEAQNLETCHVVVHPPPVMWTCALARLALAGCRLGLLVLQRAGLKEPTPDLRHLLGKRVDC